MNLEQARFNMIEQQIRPWDVLDPRVLDVLAQTPRESFVPPKYEALAFTDTEIPLGHDQVMMPPRLEGRLLQSLDIRPSDDILEIGTGSGYLTACLARLGSHVTTVELIADFLASAREKLESQNIHGVSFREGDAAHGWESNHGFDVIAVTGSLPVLHQNYHQNLKVGGRLIVIVGTPPIMEALLITRHGADEWGTESLFETSVPPLINATGPSPFSF